MPSLLSASVWIVATLVVTNALAAGALSSARSSSPVVEHHQGVHNGEICGWFINPTPGNIWLDTGSAEWTIGQQGMFEAKGDWDWPKFANGQWVHTNGGGYGYGCVCLRGVLNGSTKYVERVVSIEAHALRMCRRNPALRAKEPSGP